MPSYRVSSRPTSSWPLWTKRFVLSCAGISGFGHLGSERRCSQNRGASPFLILQRKLPTALASIGQPVLSRLTPLSYGGRSPFDLALRGDVSLRGRAERGQPRAAAKPGAIKPPAKGTNNLAFSPPSLCRASPQAVQAAAPTLRPPAPPALALDEGDRPAQWSCRPSPGLNKKRRAIIHIKS